ncbi:hypothetical protein [Burkholderia multivorans]|uniref:hypothetical protein n=1 Tax=Burkholderia multivorans TaxID=87883 RepID=UPI0015E30547|nr:hypothetical protein [Burkholderia multivorans]
MPAILSCVGGSIHPGTTPASITLVQPALGTTASATVAVYEQIAVNQPTVRNRTTSRWQTFSGNTTSPDAGFYLISAPTCAFLTSSSGTFPFTAPPNATEPR